MVSYRMDTRYKLCENLAFWHCNVGITGVAALCDLLRSSAAQWSRGSKIRLLEITSDYDPPLLEPYPFLPPEQPVPDDIPDEGGPAKMVSSRTVIVQVGLDVGPHQTLKVFVAHDRLVKLLCCCCLRPVGYQAGVEKR